MHSDRHAGGEGQGPKVPREFALLLDLGGVEVSGDLLVGRE